MILHADRLINQFFLALASLAFWTKFAYVMGRNLIFHRSRRFGHGLVMHRQLVCWLSDLKINNVAVVRSVCQSDLSEGLRLTNAIQSLQPQADESGRCTARRGRFCRLLFGNKRTAICLLLPGGFFAMVDVNVCYCFLFHSLLGFVDLYNLAGLRPCYDFLHAAARLARLLLVLHDRFNDLFVPQLHIQRVLQQLPRFLSALDELIRCLFSVL